ncbi:hypothetical protein SAMN06297164_0426 [Nitrosomonas ureae]|uniref:Uncharacterized protein n=1 Tax=Nitrosomonas ureae TaxID=44577 RepID=A0A286A376_9PROT|nr:hypothetical protein SAMN06297164_0426 [Nitrosomonas ureae]
MQDTDKNSTSSELSGAGNPLIMLSNARSSTKCGTHKEAVSAKAIFFVCAQQLFWAASLFL